MFKAAATKLAHNTTVPGLGIGSNKQLRLLHDLIVAEKHVAVALQKLSVDVAKAAEALKAWGTLEGEDLKDISAGCNALLSEFSNTILGLASYANGSRSHLKSLRAKEESLDELKDRRKSLMAKAIAADRKLGKMETIHKNRLVQANLVASLQAEIAQMDTEISAEEKSLERFKRTSMRTWLAERFSGTSELSKVGLIVAASGKLIGLQIPDCSSSEEDALPTKYQGHAKITGFLVDASRRLSNEKMKIRDRKVARQTSRLSMLSMSNTLDMQTSIDGKLQQAAFSSPMNSLQGLDEFGMGKSPRTFHYPPPPVPKDDRRFPSLHSRSSSHTLHAFSTLSASSPTISYEQDAERDLLFGSQLDEVLGLQSQVEVLQAQVNGFQMENKALKEQVESISRTCAQQIQEYSNLQFRTSSLETRHAVLQTEKSKLEAENKALNADSNVLRSNQTQLKDECTRWKRQAKEHESQNAALEIQHLAELSEQLEKVSRMRGVIEVMQNKASSRDAERSQMRDLLKELSECSICWEKKNDPIVTSCGHSFCKGCIEAHWNIRGRRECVLCRATVDRKLYRLVPLNQAIQLFEQIFSEENV